MTQDQNLNDPANEIISSPDATTDKLPEPEKNTENQKKKYLLLALIPIVLGIIAFGLWKAYQPKAVEIQGRVEAETVHISTKVPSRIEDIYVQEGQAVKKGQMLVRLHSPEVDAKKQQALASLQSALALQSTTNRGSQEENIASLYANWQSLKAQEALAKTTDQRGANLYKEGVISRQRKDEMHAAAISASEMTEAAYQQYSRAQRGSTPQQKTTADAQVDIAKAAVAEVNALEAETQLLSPIDGIVSKTYGKVSELVAMGVPVVSLIDQNFWVSLNIREDQYANVYKTKQLEGYVPALDKQVQFKIKHIDAEGDFATIKTTRQTGGYDIRSFKVHLVPTQALPDLKVGMSVLFKVEESK
ncbi:RND transporter [Acinetobacter sp. Ac_877]|uniref:HlyD family secretion protein n=1 Tax=Acinetobacter portensis TaxID=1839785 RepID=UPI00128E5492|nr:biotin/lipoyl-binding protein [Acinetobacter portensis]MPW41383.1 RND transporter [Acinetobacter portensis]